MDTKTEQEKIWADHAFNSGHSSDYGRGVSDFKQALKEAIEKDLAITRGQLSRIAIHHRSKEVRTELKSNIETTECILKLIDTVTPLKK